MAPSHPHAPRTRGSQPGDERPRLADGTEVLGEYEGSGYKEPQHLLRLGNGAVVQVTELLHLVAESIDGRRSREQVAALVSERYGRHVTADNVAVLVDKLRRLGVVALADGSEPELPEVDPLLALRFRVALVPEPVVNAVARVFAPLFWTPFLVMAMAGLFAVDGWLFFVHGLAAGVAATMRTPLLFLLAFVLVVLSAAFHEIGHATACRVGGARPGHMGAGLYLAWPAFYTDVTSAYTLGRKARLRTDLGGIYFNGLFVVALAGIYAATGFEPLLLVAFLLQIEVVHQLLPFLRLDGYYVVSDLVGVPDLFKRTVPILRSLVPGRQRDPGVEKLKPWVRRFVAGWVLVVVPLLLANLAFILVSLPRVLATAWDNAAQLAGQLRGAPLGTQAVDVLQLVFLALPILGILITLVRVATRAGVGAWSWSAGSVPRRGGVLAVAGCLVAASAVAWWPDVRTTPYRDGERGTLQQQVRAATLLGRGRPELRTPGEAQRPLPPADPAITGPLRVEKGQPAPVTPPGEGTGVGSPSPAAVPTRPAPSAAASPQSTTPPSPVTSAGPTSSPAATTAPSVTAVPTAGPSSSVAPSSRPSSSPATGQVSTQPSPSPG